MYRGLFIIIYKKKEELCDKSHIIESMKINAEYRTLPPELPISKKNIGLGIFVSCILHVLLIGALVHFTVFKVPQNKQQSVIQAQMLFTPLAQQTLATSKELTALPEQNKVNESENVNPQRSTVAEQTITESLTSEIPPISEEPPKSKTTTSSTTPIPQDIDIPTFDMSELQTQAKERLLNPRGDIGFIIGNTQRTDSLFSGLPAATETSLQAIQNDKLKQSAQLFATDYAQSVISPELIAGPAPLTDIERTQKIIQKSKIDIDCSSTLNQTLAVISQFTIQAIHCQQNENFQKFIDKRLDKGKK